MQKLFQGKHALGKSWLCSGQFAGDCCKAVPQSTGLTEWRRRSGSQVQNSVSALTFHSGIFGIIYSSSCVLHNINLCVRFVGWLYTCFTCERCGMNAINQRSTKVVATFKKKISFAPIDLPSIWIPTLLVSALIRLRKIPSDISSKSYVKDQRTNFCFIKKKGP